VRALYINRDKIRLIVRSVGQVYSVRNGSDKCTVRLPARHDTTAVGLLLQELNLLHNGTENSEDLA